MYLGRYYAKIKSKSNLTRESEYKKTGGSTEPPE